VTRLLTVLAGLVLLASVGGAAYASTTTWGTTQGFTEFYVLGADGRAGDYDTDLAVGESGTYLVGVTNHERAPTEYVLVAELGNRTVERRSLPLDEGATREVEVTVTPSTAGAYDLRLSLYRGQPTGEPYRELLLHLNVSGGG
jgi:uncharacterized membrane protein